MRTKIVLVILALVACAAAARALYRPFPSDHTPEGAYMRIARSVSEDHMNEIFPYLETEAQWAAFTIRDARAKACARIRASYPPAEGLGLLSSYAPLGDAPDGPDAFAILAARKGWSSRLRRDLSGVVHVDVDSDRASVVTARGTRYSFRRRDNGIWGLTMFTAELVAESERAARDLTVVSGAADDYDRARP